MPDKSLILTGPAGALEYVFAQPPEWCERDPISVCCHPHPLHGGTLHNKVVHTLAKTFNQLGSAALRFNFRGVGKSQGEFAKGEGEQEDLLAVIAWCRQHYPAAPLWLSGFSFGAYVAVMVHGQVNPERLLLVAPAVDMYPQMQAVQVQVADWILVQGGRDEIVSPVAVADWIKQQRNKPRLIWLEEAGHFFHGQLTRLQQRIMASWKPVT
jgi:alpha/beta superfamily hydrolase